MRTPRESERTRRHPHRVSPWWLLTAALWLATPLWAQEPGTWAPMADLNQARAGHTATLLPNGTVLIAGGRDAAGQPLASAEIYDPATGIFTLLASPLSAPVWGHTANRLNDGTVLIAGGNGDGGLAVANVQLFDPTTGTFTSLGLMASPRAQHTATLLRDGRVLLAGGTDGSSALASLEIYDSGTRALSSASQTLATPRQSHTAAMLPDGRILLAGGSNSAGALNSAELYDPAGDTVAPAGALAAARTRASAALLLDDTVLVAGGQDGQNLDLDSAEVYDPTSNAFSLLPARMGTPRSGNLGLHLLNNGRVLIGGGTSGGQLASTIELYDPLTRTFGPVGSPATVRQLFGANFFVEPYTGILLATGGLDSADQPLASSEAFYYPTLRTDKPTYAPGETVTLMGEGWVPGEMIAIRIQESSGDPDTNLAATADAQGAFVNTEFQANPSRLDVGVRFLVTASGQQSGWTAQAVFTDGNRTFDQCQDDTNNDDVKDPCVWINGSINPGISAYHEGDSVAFRIWLDGLSPNSTHTATIRYDFTKQTMSGGVIVLGYDYLTHPDATETATSQRCTDIPGPIGTSAAACAGMSGSIPMAIPSDSFAFSSSLSGANAALAGQAVATRETANPALKQIVLFGGTLTGISSIGKVGDPNTASDSQSELTITFTVGSGSGAACTGPPTNQNCRVNILFGGHLAKGTSDASGWGSGRGASSFPGASISMRMHLIDGDSSGAVNRSIQPAAVLSPAPAPGHIVVDKVTSPSGDPTSFSFSTTGTGYASFSLTDADAPNDQTLAPGSYSVTEAIPAGWILTGLSCLSSLGTSTAMTTSPPVPGPGTATASITLAAGDTVTCTFTDTKVIPLKHPTTTRVQCDVIIFPFGVLNRSKAMLAHPFPLCTATVSDVVIGAAPTTPTGTVSFFVDTSTTPFDSCTLVPTATTGVASCSVTSSVSTGMHVITATYGGDPTHESSAGATTFVVTLAPGAPGTRVTGGGRIDVVGSNGIVDVGFVVGGKDLGAVT